MQPLLSPGDIVYTKRRPTYAIGDIIVTEHPFRKRHIIKQVTSIHGEMLEVRGTHTTESEDSLIFGKIQAEQIIGTVIAIKKASE